MAQLPIRHIRNLNEPKDAEFGPFQQAIKRPRYTTHSVLGHDANPGTICRQISAPNPRNPFPVTKFGQLKVWCIVLSLTRLPSPHTTRSHQLSVRRRHVNSVMSLCILRTAIKLSRVTECWFSLKIEPRAKTDILLPIISSGDKRRRTNLMGCCV